MKQMFFRFAGIACAVALTTACSDGTDAKVVGAALPDINSAIDLAIGELGDDAEVAGDASTEPDAAAPDVQPAPDVVKIVDVLPVADVPAKTDTAQDAAPKPDVGDVTADVAAKPDATVDPCVKTFTDFVTAKTKALACTSPFECIMPVSSSLGCECQARVSAASFDYNTLNDLVALFTKAGCKASCPGPCADFKQQIGVCKTGQCQTLNVPCKDLDTYASAAMAEGIKCQADNDCIFKSSVTLGCGCPIYTNAKTMGPSKPLFLYMTMLATAYKAKACTMDVACACFDPQSAKCIDGVCVGQP